MKEIESDVISQLKTFKERNKNFIAVANQIEKNLREKEDNTSSTVLQNFPDLYDRYKNRFNEYDSDHLTSYFNYDFTDLAEKYSDQSLEECAVALGALESSSRAAVNFSNSNRFLEAIYVLDKNYEHYKLNFDNNSNPVDSDLFHEMQKERFPGYGQELNWEEAALIEATNNAIEEKKKIENEENLEEIKLKPGSSLAKNEKLYILHLLHDLINTGSEMTTTEFLRILHLTVEVVDTSADINGTPPNYRRVHDGFFKDDPTYRNRDLIKSIFSKINDYHLPMLKQILRDKLIALPGK